MKNKLITSTLLCVTIYSILFSPSVYSACKLSKETVSAVGLQETILTVMEAGRYALRVHSSVGASLELVDQVKGPGPEYGVAGSDDGRLDTFLDAGDYLLRIRGSGDAEETVRITAEPFKTVTDRPVQLPGIDPVETTLDDLESLDFWLTLSHTQMIYIDAAGRSLQDMRLWLNGSWLTDFEPILSRVEDNSGQTLKRCRLFVRCPAGTHRITVYGGEPLPWAYGGTSSPLYMRTGITSVAAAGSINRNISVFGDDLFLVDSGADFFKLGSLSIGTSLSVEQVFSDDDIQLESFYTLKINDLRKPSVERKIYDHDSRKIVVISGYPDTSYNFTWFRENYSNPARYNLNGTRDVTFFHGGNPRDHAELNAIIIEENKQSPRQETILASKRIDVEPTNPAYRSFNISKPTSFFVWFKEAGKYTLHSRGLPCRFVLETFHTHKPNDYVRPHPQNFPATVDVNTFICQLTIEPDKPGLIELAFLDEDGEPDWNMLNMSAAHADRYVHFPNLVFTDQKQYLFFTNTLNVSAGIFVGKPTLDSSIPEALFQPQKTQTPGRKDASSTKIAALMPEKQILIDKKPGVTSQIHIPISEAGVYEITAKSRFQSSFKLRSGMQTNLDGYLVPDAGNSTILRQFLTNGDYYIDISAPPNTAGPMTLSCKKLQDIQVGDIEPGKTCRTALADLTYANADIILPESGSYYIKSETLSTSPLLRLVDSNGWPLAVQTEEIALRDVDAGRYNLIQIPSPFIDAARVSVGIAADTDYFSYNDPGQMNLAKTIKGFWKDPDTESKADIWSFQLQAETELSVQLTSGMIGQIQNVAADAPVAKLSENTVWKGNVPAGEWNLLVESAFPDNLKPYSIDVFADPLVGGTRARVECPGSVGLRVGGNDAQFAIIAVDAAIDTRAVLTSSNGSVIANSDDIPGDWNPYLALWLQPGDYKLFVEPILSDPHEIEVFFTIPSVHTIQWPDSGQLSVTPGNDVFFIPLNSSPNTFSAIHVVSRGLTGITEFPISANSPVSLGRDHVFFPAQTANNGCIVWNVDGRNEAIHLEKTVIPINSQSDRADNISMKWTTKKLGETCIAVSAVSIEKNGSYLVETKGDTPLWFQTREDKPFQKIFGEKTVLYSKEGFTFAQSFDCNLGPSQTTLKRLALSRNTPRVEWLVAQNDEVWVDIEQGKKDEIVATVFSNNGKVQIGFDGHWEQNSAENSSSENMIKTLIPGGNNRQIGFRIASVKAGEELSVDQEPLSVEAAFFDAGKAIEIASSVGTYQLPPGSMAIVQTREKPNCFADKGVFIGTYDPKQRHIKFYNTTKHTKGISWSASDSMAALPDTLVVKDDTMPEIFLGSGLIQKYTFKLLVVTEIGIYVNSSSGYIQPVLADAAGRELAEGLMINKRLEPGTYTLSIKNPLNRPPTNVQPVFVLKAPENLTLFGMED